MTMGWNTLRDDLAVGLTIARAETRDRFRRNAGTRRRKAFFVLIALFATPSVILFVQQAYGLGVATRGGVNAPVVEVARNLLVPTMLALAAVAGLEAIQQLGTESVRPLLLTSASTRAIVIGKIGSLLVSWLVLVAFGFGIVIAYAIGARTPLFIFAVVVAGLPLFILLLLVGLTIGYSLWLGIERLGLSEQNRQLLTAALYLVVLVGMFAAGSLLGGGAADGQSSGLLPTGDPIVPIGWYADLLFVGSPMEPAIGLQTVIAALTVVLAIPAGFAVVVRLAPQFWYATPTESGDETDRTAPEQTQAPSESIGRTDSHFGRSRTLRAMLGYVRSGLRNPGQYVYLFYYLFPIAPVLAQQAISSPGLIPLTIGASLTVLGVWLAGGVFCLNPLGSEGTMLSQLVLATAPAATFVHARLLAGTALGLALSLSGLGILTAFSTTVTPTLALVGLLFLLATVPASAAFALGIGSVLPKFEAVEIFESVETLAPSIFAAIIHGVVATVLLLLAVASTIAVGLPASPLSLLERFGLGLLFAAVSLVVTDGSRRYAIARLRDYGYSVARTDRPFAVYMSLGIALLAFLLGQAVSIAAIFLFGFDLPVEIMFPLIFVVQYLGYAAVGLGFLYVTRRGWSYLDLSRPTLGELGYTAGGYLASIGIWLAASAVITGLGLPAADHAAIDVEGDATETLLLLLIPLVLFVNGPVEELLFRNVIQKYLAERFSVVAAVVIASVVFALIHVPAYLTAGLGPLFVTLSLLFLLSVFWGVIYVRTESLFVLSAIHGLYNATLVGVLYFTLVL